MNHSIKPGPRPMKAVWQGTTLATSENTKIVEGNYYFPAGDVVKLELRGNDADYYRPSNDVAFTVRVSKLTVSLPLPSTKSRMRLYSLANPESSTRTRYRLIHSSHLMPSGMLLRSSIYKPARECAT